MCIPLLLFSLNLVFLAFGFGSTWKLTNDRTYSGVAKVVQVGRADHTTVAALAKPTYSIFVLLIMEESEECLGCAWNARLEELTCWRGNRR